MLTESRSQGIMLIESRMRNLLNMMLCHHGPSNKRLLSRILSSMNVSKVHMMMEYAGKDSDVSDPWYTGDFEKTYRDIIEGCAGLLELLMKSVM